MSALPATSTAEVERSAVELASGLERATVAVLMGGRSSEREVSLTSGRTVLRALAEPADSDDRRGPTRVIGVEIVPDGRWRVGSRHYLPSEAALALADVDVVFIALHGGAGEDGSIQGFLACCGLAFTGSGVGASAASMDKLFARDLVAARGLCVARAVLLPRRERDRRREELAAFGERGCVVKPRSGGSSVGCSVVRRADDLDHALDLASEQGDDVLVEELVVGVEATGGVLERPDGTLLALPPVEIRPRGAFFDYHEKYSPDGALELCPPESLAPADCERVRAAALRAHRALGCRGLSRSDFIVPRDGGEPVFLELNTVPGLTPRSLLPQAAAVAGIDYRTLCLWITASALAPSSEPVRA